MRFGLLKWCLPALFCGLIGCDASNDSPSGSTNSLVTISGKATYDRAPHQTTFPHGLDYNNIKISNIRGAWVEARSGATNPCTKGKLIGTTSTDSAGNYSLTVAADTANVAICIRAQLFKTGKPSWNFAVIDNTAADAIYMLQGAPAGVKLANQTRNLHAPSGWGKTSYTGPRAAAPFAILDDVFAVIQTVLTADPNIQFLPTSVNWSVNNRPTSGDPKVGDIGTSNFDPTSAELFLLGAENVDTDEFDSQVIFHEMGHYLQFTVGRLETLSGEHASDAPTDLRVAFSEGFASALAAFVSGDPIERDANGPQQSSAYFFGICDATVGGFPEGWFSETSIGCVLYNLTTSLGFRPIHNALIGDKNSRALNSIFSFITVLKSQNPSATGAIDAALSARNIHVTDAFATGETNDAGKTDVLPVYTNYVVGSAPITLCSTKVFGEFNKLSNHRLIRFSTSGGLRTFSITGGSDPGAVLFDGGTPTTHRTSGQESFQQTLASGTYVLDVFDELNVDNNTSTGGQACLSISIS